MPNSTNYIFEYNSFVGDVDNDGYITELAIVSAKEKDTIVRHWDEIQDRHETQFEIDYMTSTQKDRGFRDEEKEDEEDSEEI